MSDNKLIKEFTKKDVTRLRNLFSGKIGDSTSIQVGYTKKEVEHKEGDIWIENDKEWIIKNGIKQTNTKLDGIKKLFNTPLVCPNCGTRMKDKLDSKMYHLHGKCFSCVLSFERELKLNGGYEKYAMDIMLNNAGTFIGEAREYIEEVKNETFNYYTEAGLKEDWGEHKVNTVAIDKMAKELKDLEILISENNDN